MDIEIKAWLFDILKAINEIEGFLLDSPKELSAYQNDLKTRRAVERNIEIIGEAMNRVLQKDASLELSNSRKIVDTEIESSMAMILFLMILFGQSLFLTYRH